MQLGTDLEGRSITYDEVSYRFAIGGIDTSLDRVIAYDRGKQIQWASPEIQQWAYDAEAARQEAVRAVEAADAASATTAAEPAGTAAVRSPTPALIPGYEPESVIRFARGMKGLATIVTVLLTIGGAIEGVVLGTLLGALLSSAGAVLILGVLFGATGFAAGYLLGLFLKLSGNLMLAAVQLEMNTRSIARREATSG